MSSLALRPNTLVGDRYRLEAPLDDWGVGTTWTALDLSDGAVVALKFLPPIPPSERSRMADFDALGRALVRLRHPSIAATLGHGFWQGHPWLAMAYMPGVSLARAFAMARTGKHLLAPGPLANLFDRACEAVAAAHAAQPAMVHGGIMPGSLVAAMLTGHFEVRVLDFGLAPRFGARLAVPRATEYRAPALEDAPEAATALDDIFSLGTLVMEAITERQAPRGLDAGTLGNLSAVAKRRPDLPAALMAVATRATRLVPQQRYPDVRALREALADAWSPDTRPTPDTTAPAQGVAGVAAEYTSWVSFSDAPSPPEAIAPVAPVAPVVQVEPLVLPALVATPQAEARPHRVATTPAVDFESTQRMAPSSVTQWEETQRLPRVAPEPLPLPTAPAVRAAAPATQLLVQLEAASAPKPPHAAATFVAPAPPPAAPVAAPPPQAMYGVAPTAQPMMYGVAPTAQPAQPAPSSPPRRGLAVVLALAALAALAALVALALGMATR